MAGRARGRVCRAIALIKAHHSYLQELATLATYFAYQTISLGSWYYTDTLTQTYVVKSAHTKYFRSDHNSTRDQNFQKIMVRRTNCPGILVPWTKIFGGPKFSWQKNGSIVLYYSMTSSSLQPWQCYLLVASLSEPHTSVLNGGFSYLYICIYLPYVRRSVNWF